MRISGLNEFKECLIFVENQGQICYFQKLRHNTGILRLKIKNFGGIVQEKYICKDSYFFPHT